MGGDAGHISVPIAPASYNSQARGAQGLAVAGCLRFSPQLASTYIQQCLGALSPTTWVDRLAPLRPDQATPPPRPAPAQLPWAGGRSGNGNSPVVSERVNTTT